MTINQRDAVSCNPIPNPHINVLVRTAGLKDALNPTGQLDSAYKYGRLLTHSVLATKEGIAEMYLNSLLAIVQDSFRGNSFASANQTVTYLLDGNFVGFVNDPSMKRRFLTVAASKMMAFFPELLAKSMQAILDLEQVIEAARQGCVTVRTSNSKAIRNALVFQSPSLFNVAASSIQLYHLHHLICRVLNGFSQLILDYNDVVFTKFLAYADQAAAIYYKYPAIVSKLWNYSISALNDVDVPIAISDGQNINAIDSIFSYEFVSNSDYIDNVLDVYNEITDTKTPNWLTSHSATKNIDRSYIEYGTAMLKEDIALLQAFSNIKEV